MNIFSIIVLICRIMVIYYIFNTVTHYRNSVYIPSVLLSWGFCLTLFYFFISIQSSIVSIFSLLHLIRCSGLAHQILFISLLRSTFLDKCLRANFICVCPINNKDEEETMFDVVKDFTSLLVLLEIHDYVANGLSRYTQKIV